MAWDITDTYTPDRDQSTVPTLCLYQPNTGQNRQSSPERTFQRAERAGPERPERVALRLAFGVDKDITSHTHIRRPTCTAHKSWCGACACALTSHIDIYTCMLHNPWQDARWLSGLSADVAMIVDITRRSYRGKGPAQAPHSPLT